MEILDLPTTETKTRQSYQFVRSLLDQYNADCFLNGAVWQLLPQEEIYSFKDLVQILASQAILGFHQGGCPGKHRGHSILYDNFVRDGKLAISQEFHKRLITGSFWEGLGESSNSTNPLYLKTTQPLDDLSLFDTSFDGKKILRQSSNPFFKFENLRLHNPNEQQLDNYLKMLEQYEHFESDCSCLTSLQHLTHLQFMMV